MEYLDFELRITAGAGREYPVSVQSPAGETSSTMSFPFDTLALQNQLQGVEIAVLRSGGTRRDVVSEEQLGVSDFGRKLFDALMTDTVRETFRRSRDRARASGKGLRLRLRIEAPELAALPWEYLYDTAEGDYVCLSTDTPVVRYLEFDRPPEPLTIRPPLSILGVIASPTDRAALDVSREKQRVEAATAPLRNAGLLKLTWLDGSTWRDLQKAMRQGPYHIFHFVGHGGFDAASREGVIALTDEEGKSALMSATQLGRLLADHQSLRMVVLNSCLGAKGSATDVFSSTASILVRRGVSAVVAMQYEISDLAAVEFARSLYEALADGMPVDAAVAEARKAISLSVHNTVEWGTPVLHMRSCDGLLFRINGMTTSLARASGTYKSMPVPAVRIPSEVSPAPPAPTPRPAPSAAPAHATSPAMPESLPVRPEGSKRRRALLVGLAAVVLSSLAGGYFLFHARPTQAPTVVPQETGESLKDDPEPYAPTSWTSTPSASLAANFPPDCLSLAAVSRFDPDVYSPREDARCEGMYDKDLGTRPLAALSLTSTFEAYDPASTKSIQMEWSARADDGVRIRVRAIRPNLPYAYGMYVFVPSGFHNFSWPTEMVSKRGFGQPDLGALAWTRRPLPGGWRDVYLPLHIARGSDLAPAREYTLVLVPKSDLQEVYLTLGPAGTDGKPLPGKLTKDHEPQLQGSYRAERPIRIRIPKLNPPGLYYLEVSGILPSGSRVPMEPMLIDTSVP